MSFLFIGVHSRFQIKRRDDAIYLDTSRGKRNTAEYAAFGGATEADARELSVWESFCASSAKDVIVTQ